MYGTNTTPPVNTNVFKSYHLLQNQFKLENFDLTVVCNLVSIVESSQNWIVQNLQESFEVFSTIITNFTAEFNSSASTNSSVAEAESDRGIFCFCALDSRSQY